MERVELTAPLEQITIEGNIIKTDWGGGIKFEHEVISMIYPDTAKSAFRIAIAMASKKRDVQFLMNNWAEETMRILNDEPKRSYAKVKK